MGFIYLVIFDSSGKHCEGECRTEGGLGPCHSCTHGKYPNIPSIICVVPSIKGSPLDGFSLQIYI